MNDLKTARNVMKYVYTLQIFSYVLNPIDINVYQFLEH